MTITFTYILTAALAGLIGLAIGFFLCGLFTAGSDADEWLAGYLAGRRQTEEEDAS